MPKAVNYQNNGDGTATLTMTWTAPKPKLDAMGSDSGEFYYNQRWTIYDGTTPKAWGDLTNAQKLNVLLKECTHHLRKGAYHKYEDDTMDTARAAMDTPEDKYNMED